MGFFNAMDRNSWIAYKTTSLKHLEQLAQELILMSPTSGRPTSMASTMSSTPTSPVLATGPSPLAFMETETETNSRQAGRNEPAMSDTKAFSSHAISSSPVKDNNRNTKHDLAMSRSNWATTSHVIEHLQQTIDSLRNDLSAQTAKAIEEKQGRDTIRKRCDNAEHQMEQLQHQNDTLSSIINRKDRRLKDMEREADTRLRNVESLQEEQKKYIESKDNYEALLANVKDEQEQASVAYDAVISDTNSSRANYERQFAEVSHKIKVLAELRSNDKQRIAQLQELVAIQQEERAHVDSIKNEMEKQRQRHAQDLITLMDQFQTRLAKSNAEAEQKVDKAIMMANEAVKACAQMELDNPAETS